MSAAAEVVELGLAAIVKELKRLPPNWSIIPVGGDKAPQYSGWQNSRFSVADFEKALVNGQFDGALCKKGEPSEYVLPSRYIKAAGVLCGVPSGGLLFFDHDGHSCDQKILELSGAASIAEAMPKTPVVTSGRSGRYQAIYQVPERFWQGIETTKIGTKFKEKDNGQVVAIEGVEFRWSGAQSVVTGRHPETGGYRWYYHPQDVPLAEAPTWMLEAMLSDASEGSAKAKSWSEFDKTFTLPCDHRVDLVAVCAPKTRKALESGPTDKGRNDTGAQIARDLLGAANYLDSIGQAYDGNPEDIFHRWCDSFGLTQDKPKGQPKTIWAKAEKDRPSPSLNPTQIEGCLKSWVWKNTDDSTSGPQEARQGTSGDDKAISYAEQKTDASSDGIDIDGLKAAIAHYAGLKDPFERFVYAKNVLRPDFGAGKADLANLSMALTPPATTGVEELADVLRGTLTEIERRAEGGALPVVKTGFLDLDRMLIGLKRKHLVVLGGRAAMGKTGFSVALALNAASQGKRVLFISLEMTKQEISERMLANIASIDSHDIQTGNIPLNKWEPLGHAVAHLSGLPIFIDDTPRMPLAQIEELAVEHKADIVFIDHALKVDAPGRDDRERVVYTSGFLKDMAKRTDAVVVLLSQINREVQKQANKRPTTSDLKQSGSLEEDADLVMLLYREEVYNPDTEERGVAEVILGKHRNGPTGTVRLLFEPEYTRFRNLAPRIG